MNRPFFFFIEKSEHSALYRWFFNRLLNGMIPFNKPHGFSLDAMGPDWLEVTLPYKRSNKNHIGGLHACALATASELASGLQLMRALNSTKYRIVMKSLSVEYLYQGKTRARARSSLTQTELKTSILDPLDQDDAILYSSKVVIHDELKNALCESSIDWQVKKWDAVRTAT